MLCKAEQRSGEPKSGTQHSVMTLSRDGQAEIDGSNENGFGEQNPSLNTTRLMEEHMRGRRLVIHNGDISYARCALRRVRRTPTETSTAELHRGWLEGDITPATCKDSVKCWQ